MLRKIAPEARASLVDDEKLRVIVFKDA